jgi:hypothetical protein
VFLFGANPGLFIGGGSSTVQLTVGVDVPLYFAGALAIGDRSGAGSGFAATVRPYVTLEGTPSAGLGLFLTGAIDQVLSGGGGFLYASVQAGFTF